MVWRFGELGSLGCLYSYEVLALFNAYPNPTIPNAPDRALLDRYLTGECSAAEAELVREWLAAGHANRARIKELRDIREVMASRATWDVLDLWRQTAQGFC